MKYSQKALKTYKMYRYLKKQTIMFMKRMTYTTKFMSAFAIVTLLALLTACRDEVDDVIQPGALTADKSLTEQFDAIWHGINQNYVFWEADPTDWDAVYSQYRPRFVELDKQEAVPTADLQKLYEERRDASRTTGSSSIITPIPPWTTCSPTLLTMTSST